MATMRDFGEYLVDIRDRLDHPLPMRVVQWRVFLAAFLETFCLGYVRLLRRNYRFCLGERYGLHDPGADFDEVRHAFAVLEGKSGSHEQVLQAHDAYFAQLHRRIERLNGEVERWIAAGRAGTFLGLLLYAIAVVTLVLCCITDHMLVFGVGIIVFVGSEYLVCLICLRGWHRS
jgi:hypothetical protein